MEYNVIAFTDLTRFVEEVNKHIDEGWKPLGGIGFAQSHLGSHSYAQAMIREDAAASKHCQRTGASLKESKEAIEQAATKAPFLEESTESLVTWRDVLDCKVAGMNINELASIARELMYQFVCHNDHLYWIDQSGNPHYTSITIDRQGRR